MPKINNLTDTWDNLGTDFDGIKLDVTDTNSGAGSNLLDLLKDGTTQYSVSKVGATYQVGASDWHADAKATTRTNLGVAEATEGTFTITIADAASGGNEGTPATAYYRRIGNMLFVTADIENIDTTGLTAGNTLFMTGLPVATGINNQTGAVYVTQTTYTGSLSLRCSSDWCQVVESVSGGAFSPLLVSAFSSGTADIRLNAALLLA